MTDVTPTLTRRRPRSATRSGLLLAVFALLIAIAGCTSAGDGGGPSAPTTAVGASPTTAHDDPATTPAPTTAASTTTAVTTTTSVDPPTTVASPSTTTTLPGVLARRELGTSVEGRPITAIERGTKGGTPVVVIGVIHGDEDAGVAIVDDLERLDVPSGIDLWLVPSMNPDGQANRARGNAHQVDLNRNFPLGWAKLGQPGEWQYAGTGPASEPETKAIVDFLEEVRPSLVIWYHQDLNRIAPATGRAGRIRQRYAQLTGLPIAPVTGGTYTGVAAGWARTTLPGSVAFIVELGPSLTSAEAETHAKAVLAVARL